MKPISILIMHKETFKESVKKDLFTFGMLLICMYFSLGSTPWSITLISMFLLFVFIKVTMLSDSNKTHFSSPEEAIDYLKAISPNK